MSTLRCVICVALLYRIIDATGVAAAKAMSAKVAVLYLCDDSPLRNEVYKKKDRQWCLLFISYLTHGITGVLLAYNYQRRHTGSKLASSSDRRGETNLDALISLSCAVFLCGVTVVPFPLELFYSTARQGV